MAVMATACNGSSPSTPSGLTSTDPNAAQQGGGKSGDLSMDASQWSFRFSPGMPARPSASGQGWMFVFPNANGVHYLTTAQKTSMPARTMSASIAIETTGSPVFDYHTEPGNTCDAPATVRLFFQRHGDNMSGDGKYAYYRWWSNPISYVLAAGSVTLTGDLTDLSQWTSVNGERAADHAAEFHAAMADEDNVGFTFGGGCFFGHGVFVTSGTGQATFHATQFIVK